MLSYLLRQLTNSFGIFFRTIRAFFTRKLVGVWSYLRRITNFSRQATKVASASLQGAAAAVKKPTRREDYIETRRLFISKSFLILLAIGVVLLALLIYFVIWPFLLRTFFTARLWQDLVGPGCHLLRRGQEESQVQRHPAGRPPPGPGHGV